MAHSMCQAACEDTDGCYEFIIETDHDVRRCELKGSPLSDWSWTKEEKWETYTKSEVPGCTPEIE